MIGTAVVGAGLGVYQTLEGAKQKEQARKALEEYKRQELKNVGENLTVSTLGTDALREEQSKLTAQQLESLSGGGNRSLVGGLGRVEAGNQAVNDKIAASLDEKQKEIDMIVAEDEVRIRNMKENREIGDVSALSSQYNAGNEAMQQGIGQAVQGIGMAFNQYGGKADNTTTTGKTETPNSNISNTPNNELNTGQMTKTGGSGLGATNQPIDDFGNKINTNTSNTPLPKRRKFGLGYTENYDGTLNFE
jgi:hypothetical protein